MKQFYFLLLLPFFLSCQKKDSPPSSIDLTLPEGGLNEGLPENGIVLSADPDGVYDKLVWSDEFDVAGRPDPEKWFHETVPPNNGSWWNNEFQHYTDRPENSYVDDGTLKIVARRENYQGKEFTSARMNTQNLFYFIYGRLEVRAKLPTGAGTWPAFWMLGANIDTIGWPFCGEVDLMEHGNKEPGVVSSAVHLANSEGNHYYLTNETAIQNENSEYHIYALEWSPDKIIFTVDDVQFHQFTINPAMPFYNRPFFIILNIAMGGHFTGNYVDPDFTESTMEIDYVRVYQ